MQKNTSTFSGYLPWLAAYSDRKSTQLSLSILFLFSNQALFSNSPLSQELVSVRLQIQWLLYLLWAGGWYFDSNLYKLPVSLHQCDYFDSIFGLVSIPTDSDLHFGWNKLFFKWNPLWYSALEARDAYFTSGTKPKMKREAERRLKKEISKCLLSNFALSKYTFNVRTSMWERKLGTSTSYCTRLKRANKMCICIISQVPAQVCQFNPLSTQTNLDGNAPTAGTVSLSCVIFLFHQVALFSLKAWAWGSFQDRVVWGCS